jgi:DNA replicative helicase MCM subunit Mcm2 (Cdc46/Mcm family)
VLALGEPTRPRVTILPVKRRRRRSSESEGRLADEASYVCGSCGEEIVVPLDPTGGEHQQYVEDCPVCCVPNEVFVDYDEDGSARVTSRHE